MTRLAEQTRQERGIAIEEATARLGLLPTIVEKDYWVCWLLGVIFSDPRWEPHLVLREERPCRRCFMQSGDSPRTLTCLCRRSCWARRKVISMMRRRGRCDRSASSNFRKNANGSCLINCKTILREVFVSDSGSGLTEVAGSGTKLTRGLIHRCSGSSMIQRCRGLDPAGISYRTGRQARVRFIDGSATGGAVRGCADGCRCPAGIFRRAG